MAFNMLAEWRKAQEEEIRGRVHVQTRSKQWCKPPDGWIKINKDAACRQGEEHIGVGCVVRNDMRDFLGAHTNVIRSLLIAREAEALSLKEALSWMKSWRTTK